LRQCGCKGHGGLLPSDMAPRNAGRKAEDMSAKRSNEIRDCRGAGSSSQSSDQRLAALLDSITEGFVGVGFDWRYTYVNESAARFLRKSKDQLIGENVFQAFPEAEGTVFEKGFRQAMTKRVTASFESFYEPLESWFECRCYPSPDGISVLFADTTQKKRQENELRLYQEMVRNANSAIIRWKRDGTISFFNEFAQELFCYNKEQIIGKNVGILVPEIESSGTDLTGLVQDIVTHPELYINNINENVRRDGSRIWMNWTNKALFDEAGQVAEILAVGSDVTKLKLAEEELRRSEASFKLLSKTAGRLLETPHPQRIVDDLCREVMKHLGCHVFFNFLADEKAGKLRLNACAGIPTEEAKKIEWLDYGVAVCGCVARQGVPIVAEDIFNVTDIRTELVRSYGVQAYACHPLMSQGRLIGTLSFGTKNRAHFLPEELALMKTITDQVAVAMERISLIEELHMSRDELEMRVRERTAELELKNNELQEFVFIASHDLREPLRKVETFGSMLATKYGVSLDDTSRDYIMRMRTAALRMKKLLNSLLAYSRVSTKAEPLKKTDLNKSVKEALSNLEIMVKEKNARVEVGELPTVKADRVQMNQLFQNLIGNALKFSQNNQPPQVKVYAQQVRDAKGAYEICVEDNGIGFEEKYLDRIFLPFQTLHGRSSDYEGVGIGLAICKKIVERHGGDLTAKSVFGKGSTFIVTFPQ
jgi:PAS domain S-box-containing protein